MIVSINYQHLFDFNREWNFPLISDSGARSHADYRQKGMLSAIGIAYAVRVSTNFSLGLTFNIWDDGLTRNRWEQHTFQESTGNDNGQAFMEESHYIDRYSLRGYNANLGFLWHINDRLTIGGVLKTPFKADVEHEYGIEASIRYPESPDAYSETSYSVAEEADLEMPISYGIGFAYRFSDMLTVSLDVYRTEWDNFVFTDSKGNSSSLITAGTPPAWWKSVTVRSLDGLNFPRRGVCLLRESKSSSIEVLQSIRMTISAFVLPGGHSLSWRRFGG